MDKEICEKYKRAGNIAGTALEYGRKLIVEGAKVVDILDKVEEKIRELGAKPAFPAQISLNEVAAHDCANMNDETMLQDQVVKLDCGAHIDGYIGDNAVTVDLSGNFTDLLKASREARDEALKLAVPGTKIGELGKTVQEVIESFEFAPVKNLSGHGLDQYVVHTKPSVPNYDNKNPNQLQEGMVIAIEPFASTGAGIIEEAGIAKVFSIKQVAGIRDPITRNVLKEIQTYKKLPFCRRWLEKKFGERKTNYALATLAKHGALHEHPPLVDRRSGMVSQSEHTVIVSEKPIITTKI